MSWKLMYELWQSAPDLNKGEWIMLSVLAFKAQRDLVCRASLPTLAKLTQLDERSLSRIAQRLERGGYLSVQRRSGRSNAYAITQPPVRSEEALMRRVGRRDSMKGGDSVSGVTNTPRVTPTPDTESPHQYTQSRPINHY